MKRVSSLLDKKDILTGVDNLFDSISKKYENLDQFSAFFTTNEQEAEEAQNIAAIITTFSVKDQKENISYIQCDDIDKLYYKFAAALIFSNHKKLQIIETFDNKKAYQLFELLSRENYPSALACDDFIYDGLNLKRIDYDIFDYKYLFPFFNECSTNNIITCIISRGNLPYLETFDPGTKDLCEISKMLSLNECSLDDISTPYDDKIEDDYLIRPTLYIDDIRENDIVITSHIDLDFLESLKEKTKNIILISRKKVDFDYKEHFFSLAKAKEAYSNAILLGPEFL